MFTKEEMVQMNLESFNSLMTIILVALVVGVTLIVAFILFSKNNKKVADEDDGTKKKGPTPLPNAQREDIMNFLPFETIENDMIIQDMGERFTALIECSGINYYLMSEVEKISVEECFIQFLNSIRYPIQLYIQTRTVSLDDSIDLYKKRLATLETEYNDKIMEFRELDKKGASEDELYEVSFEIQKKENVINYTRDLIQNVSYMTNNHNVLEKKYYIVISYLISEACLVNKFTADEMKDVAYTELSTKADSIRGALAGARIECHMLSSEELAEVMYVALKRDDADIMNFKKAMSSQFFGLYSTAKDPIVKRKEMERQEKLKTKDNL